MNKNKGYFFWPQLLLAVLLTLASVTGCKKFVTIDVPKGQLVDAFVFDNVSTANAAIAGIYQGMVAVSSYYCGNWTINKYTGLSSDEFDDYSGENLEFNENGLIPSNPAISIIWDETYKYIYTTNSIIEGLQKSAIDSVTRNAFTGEAKFLRAFFYFHLVNLFGDVPLVLQTDYNITKLIKRTSKETVYAQMIQDLKDAEMLLKEDYSIGKNERVRPNKSAAAALLARVYLFSKDYENSQASASTVIDNSVYAIDSSLNNVFLANGNEAILQFIPESGYTYDAGMFILTDYPARIALTDQLANSFEANDKRKIDWVGEINVDGTDFFYANKYKNPSEPDYSEYYSVLRLAEQYLIRAEAYAQQNNLPDAIADLNVIRKRAGLPDLNNALTKEDILLAVEKERRSELFSEWGHRWFDLKRTQGFNDPTKTRADEVLSVVKGSLWQSTDMLYPIAQKEVTTAMLEQNPGYE